MPNNVAHFAIHADDTDRAKAFYEAVFGWKFSPWGPPGFYMIQTGTEEDPGIHGSLQKRVTDVVGQGVIAFECTVSVDSVDDVAAAVTANGGEITVPKMQLPTIGWLIQFQDTEGNIVCAMKYLETPAEA